MTTTAYHNIREAAANYCHLGYAVIPIPDRKKGAILTGWQKLRITEQDLHLHFNDEPQNIGILLGTPSGGLVDVDLDSPEAVRIADGTLPDTDLVTGRKSKPRSHYFYRCDLKTKKFADPEDHSMLLELRSDGTQTLFPPSVHPSCETYEFYSDGEPAVVAADELLQSVAQVAAMALVAKHWPAQGSRQDAAMALAGALLRAGIEVERIWTIMRQVCDAAGDREVGKRISIVQITADRIAGGENSYGFPKLKEILGSKVASRAIDWLTGGEKLRTHEEARQEMSEKIDAAKETLKNLPDLLQQDRGAAFGLEIMGALALVRRHDPAEWARVKDQLQRAKVSIRDVDREIAKSRPANLRIVEPGQHAEPHTAGDALAEDCPAPALLIPAQFSLRTDATIQIITKIDPLTKEEINADAVVAHAPILITSRLRDIDEGTVALELAYKRPDGWHRLIVDRRTALDSQKIIELAGSGFPVASTNAKSLVSYLHEVEAANFESIPTSSTASHLGWQGKDGELGFLCGHQLILPDDAVAPLTGAGHEKRQLVGFRALAPGDQQIADAFHAAGSVDAWLSAVKVLQRYRRVLFGVYASFVAPLLMILGAPSFILDWASRTSTGKTTTLRGAVSVWGNPNEQEENSLLWSWDSTAVYLERTSAVLHSLPIFLDETQRAKDARFIASTLYEVAHGRGRARGNTQSVSRTRTWRTVLFSTGEMPATSFTQDGGTRARCIEIRGYPFGAANPATARVVADLNVELKSNFGHAGPIFLQAMLMNCDKWDGWKDQYQKLVAGLSGRVPKDAKVDAAIVDRLAHYMAAVQLAAARVHEWFGLPWDFKDPLEEMWLEIVAESNEATGEERALRDVLSWSHSQQHTFLGRHQSDQDGNPRAPARGWSGRWDPGDDWNFIAFYPTVLSQVLTELRYSPDTILPGWKERRWLDIAKGRMYDKAVWIRCEQKSAHMIVIRKDAIDEIETP
ncbi:MAG: hypothetical protein DMG57_31720 [Acidobacteria bacterium]|nr:MAG: hypothetical protein DMG57_31720 [Acidobacteriota bacterium]